MPIALKNMAIDVAVFMVLAVVVVGLFFFGVAMVETMENIGKVTKCERTHNVHQCQLIAVPVVP